MLVFDKRIFHVILEAVSGSIKTTSRKRDTIVTETREGRINDLWIEEILRGHPTKEKLIGIIRKMPELCRDAWHELMRTGRSDTPDNKELILIMADVSGELRDEIWQILLERGDLEEEEKRYIMEHIPEYRDAAARILPSPKGKILERLEKPTASRQKR